MPKSVLQFRFFNTALTFEERSIFMDMKTFKKACFHLIQQKNVQLRKLQDLGGHFVIFEDAQHTFPFLLQQEQIDQWTLTFSKCKDGATPLGWTDFINVTKNE